MVSHEEREEERTKNYKEHTSWYHNGWTESDLLILEWSKRPLTFCFLGRLINRAMVMFHSRIIEEQCYSWLNQMFDQATSVS